jgi:dTDP-4-amino-4,6-dideoxygalactose transaminase
MKLIPFSRPFLPEKAIDHLRAAVANKHLSGDGPFTRRCHAWLERTLGVPKALLTTSCTHALEMAALLLDIQPSDEVIVPAFTFVSTVNAFVLRGARPIFVDVLSDTLNMDANALADLITPRTKAIVPVHYSGVACDMTRLLAISRESGVPIVEDNAHGLFGKYQGQWLGTFGALATLSFHETKNMSCGEGGALLINDAKYCERAEILREKGTDRSRFFRGQVDKYTWVDLGSSFLPSDALAALLFAQLEMADAIQARRRAIWNRYASELADWGRAQGVQLPHVPAGCEHPAHLFFVVLPSLEDRDALIEHLRRRGVCSVFHYQPLHLSPMGQKHGGRAGQCPVTEALGDRLTRLPIFFELTDQDQGRVIDAVTSFQTAAQRLTQPISRAA